jgi:hypothetical protein
MAVVTGKNEINLLFVGIDLFDHPIFVFNKNRGFPFSAPTREEHRCAKCPNQYSVQILHITVMIL